MNIYFIYLISEMVQSAIDGFNVAAYYWGLSIFYMFGCVFMSSLITNINRDYSANVPLQIAIIWFVVAFPFLIYLIYCIKNRIIIDGNIICHRTRKLREGELETCIICMDKKVNIEIDCNHIYCSKCILRWIHENIHPKCPVCNKTIKNKYTYLKT